MNNQPFRLVFNNLLPNELDLIKDIMEWRMFQHLPDVDFFVIKLGYHNTINSFDFHQLLTFFKSDFFKNKNIKFSLFQNINEINNSKIQLYDNFSIELQKFNPNFICSLAFVYNEELNALSDFNLIPPKNNLKYNLYLHHVTNIDTILTSFNSKLFDGFDLTSFFNHFENPVFDNRLKLIEILKNLPKNILETIFPEFLNWSINNKTYKDDIYNFCKDGYFISNQRISPLIYGSFDDFTIQENIDTNQFLLMTFTESLQYWNKILTKKIYNSHCFSCDAFSLCQNKSYFWNNLNETDCSLNIIDVIYDKFDKNLY